MRKLIAAGLTLLLMSFGGGAYASVLPYYADADRIAGEDRYETAVQVSQKVFPDTAPVVYLVTGAAFADALSAGPVAMARGGSVLLTRPDGVPDVVLEEMKRLQPSEIVVVGGGASVSAVVMEQVQSLADSVVRVGGKDRYDTSRMLIVSAGSLVVAPEQVFVVTGRDFPDALAAAGAAAKVGGVVVLVDGMLDRVDDATLELIRGLSPKNISVVGGDAVVSEGVRQSLSEVVENPDRIGGYNRYGTAENLLYTFWSDFFENPGAHPIERVFVVTGGDFPDALVTSMLVWRTGHPLLLSKEHCILSDVGVWPGGDPWVNPWVTFVGGEQSVGGNEDYSLWCNATP